MPVEAVVRATCDRCGRQWFLAAKEGETLATPQLDLHLLSPDGEVVYEASFNVLCSSCVKTVTSYVEGVCRDLTKPRAKKKRKGEPPAEAPPKKG